ncbi:MULTISPECIES: proton-conducting transporter membrane subunit [unclassified Gemella]|uniref:proton-conducting transporter transmembrane domain-containing protein n=1 Tax=unclassified Gemella TaxID=2624949 RepID=UPI001073FBC0|nr:MULTISPECIES: proton-conducting transporter membrane subunit [unclassified Gemella]MBF0710707.1 sodium:proton antiporter [Gemella sp. GL1.1]MBF0746724.1 sodium:proton antiporter [Gemella sp. 19428wG2_WT2a]NYS28051.1 sodium:proton antiporter [Gemella sp. GL1]TFU60072.1 sodium:proton antiporter [Gemella sp. WT2a]
MTSNLPVLPIFIPLLFAAITIFFKNKVKTQRSLTLVASLLLLLSSLYNLLQVNAHKLLYLEMGNWPAPFGITLVLDGLAAILVFTSSIVFLVTLLYSFKTIDKNSEQSFFYSGLLLIIAGINGAFTTGDIFNLFVFYEILLMASYLLLLVGISKEQLKSSISYVLMNVFAGSLFVISVGYLYTITGSLNMAHISDIIQTLADKRALFLVGLVMIFVFAMKGALFPLFTWMNRAYAAPPIAVSIVFAALLTKVGLYSMVRTFSLFYSESNFIKYYLLILGLISIIAGSIGAIYQKNLKQIAIYNIVISLGVMVTALAVLNKSSVKGLILYTVNDILLKAALFILIGLIIYVSGIRNIKKAGLINKYPLLAWTFFLLTLSLAGVPPLPGFYGKALIIKGLAEANHFIAALIVTLSGLVVFYSLIKIFLNVFYDNINKQLNLRPLPKSLVFNAITLLVVAIVVGLSSNYLDFFLESSVSTILEPKNYIDIVLKKG